MRLMFVMTKLCATVTENKFERKWLDLQIALIKASCSIDFFPERCSTETSAAIFFFLPVYTVILKILVS